MCEAGKGERHKTPQAATEAAAALLCDRQSGRTAYRPQAKPAPTDFDLQPDSHTQLGLPFNGLHPRNTRQHNEYKIVLVAMSKSRLKYEKQIYYAFKNSTEYGLYSAHYKTSDIFVLVSASSLLTLSACTRHSTEASLAPHKGRQCTHIIGACRALHLCFT